MLVCHSFNVYAFVTDTSSEYSSILGQQSNNLKKQLSQEMWKDYVPLSYTEAKRNLFGLLDLKKDERGYYVKDVYCNRIIRDGAGPMKIPNYEIINCEHTWPQSRFNKSFSSSAQKSDLHHLYPTDSIANSSRGNIEFADVDGGATYDKCQASNIGIPQESGYRAQRYFEPPFEHKGNVARAVFYISIKYDNKITSTEEHYLRLWNVLDPVDEDEMNRNELIEQIQGNRNPFIDHPELVDEITDF